jgi:hypothetical protein
MALDPPRRMLVDFDSPQGHPPCAVHLSPLPPTSRQPGGRAVGPAGSEDPRRHYYRRAHLSRDTRRDRCAMSEADRTHAVLVSVGCDQ